VQFRLSLSLVSESNLASQQKKPPFGGSFWLGRKDLNPHLTESESVVLPLDHSPNGTLKDSEFKGENKGFAATVVRWRYAVQGILEAINYG
jgi:hypothetical protein